jgi:hypothetical protein
MNTYSSQTLPSIYPYSIVRQYSSPPYYYFYNEYPSSAMSYTMTVPHDRYSSSLNYRDDDEDAYFSETHRHHHRSHHRQYSNHQNSSRARNISR